MKSTAQQLDALIVKARDLQETIRQAREQECFSVADSAEAELRHTLAKLHKLANEQPQLVPKDLR